MTTAAAEGTDALERIECVDQTLDLRGNENDLARFHVEVVFIPALTYFPGDRRPEYLRRWWA